MRYNTVMNTNKVATSFRLSEQAIAIIDSLSTEFGVSKTSIVEIAVREMKERKDAKR
jgi:predicted DNA-binding protein